MLPNKFETPLDLTIKPSKYYTIYIILICFFSFVSLFFLTSLPYILKSILSVVLIIMAALIIKKQKSHSITKVRLTNNSLWEIEQKNKHSFKVELVGECIVTSFLIWLNFSTFEQSNKKVFHLLILPDSVEPDLLRQLRVRLRFLIKNNPEIDSV